MLFGVREGRGWKRWIDGEMERRRMEGEKDLSRGSEEEGARKKTTRTTVD